MKLFSKLSNVMRQKSIIFSAALMLLLVVINAGFQFYNGRVLERTTATQAQATEIKNIMSMLWDDIVRNADLAVRGYGINKDENLLIPYQGTVTLFPELCERLEEKMQQQGYPDAQGFVAVKRQYGKYYESLEKMIEFAKIDRMDQFRGELKLDAGRELWSVYYPFTQKINQFQDSVYNAAQAEYKAVNSLTLYSQMLLVIISIPTLLFMIFRIVQDSRARRTLFEELEKNNREYIFDPGTPLEFNNEREVIDKSIQNFKKAASFINEVSAGNMKVNWEELNDQNKALNQQNLAGDLINMREKMKALKEEDSKRLWITEGQAKFSEIIRTHQNDLQSLCNHSIAFIVKYLGAQQGGVFVLKEAEGNEKYLELFGCYAFERKKFVEKRIEIGQGLVGQTYLEQEPVMLTNIPQAYTQITSGLGDATPKCLLVVPMKYNEKVEAVIEVAGFKVYEPYQLEWLAKLGEIMASTLISIRTTETTRDLLEQFKSQAEQLSAQEEELRQNMEELEATQEEMRRKEQELERRHEEMQKMLDAHSA